MYEYGSILKEKVLSKQSITSSSIIFEAVLDGLVIDIENDPNSMDTGRRLAKMYINELMAGRYDPMPNATAFRPKPNVDSVNLAFPLHNASETSAMKSLLSEPFNNLEASFKREIY